MARGFGTTLGVGATDRLAGPTFACASQMSLSAWINVNGLGGSSTGTIFSNSANTANGVEAAVATNTTTLRWRARWTTPGIWTVPLASVGTWQHILITYDRSSTANRPVIYVNGISQTVTQTQAPLTTFGTTAQLASIGNMATAFNWDGMLAHVAWWNGVLLNPSEALALASGVSPLMIRPDALAFYAPLDGVNNPEPDLIGQPWAVTAGTRFASNEPPQLAQPAFALEPRFNFRAAAPAVTAQLQRAMVLA